MSHLRALGTEILKLFEALAIETICGLVGVLIPVVAGFVGFEARSGI